MLNEYESNDTNSGINEGQIGLSTWKVPDGALFMRLWLTNMKRPITEIKNCNSISIEEGAT